MTAEWKVYKIGDIADTTSGGTPSRKKKEYYYGSTPWVKSGELDDNYIYKTEEKITEEALKYSSAKLFPTGTLLIAMYGATVGKTSILQIDAATNQAVCAVFPSKDLANAHFLRYYFIYSRPTLLRQRYGGAQPNISQTIIRNFEVTLPPLVEQQNIVHILSKIQSAIETQEKIIRTTTELKKALMQKLFTEGLHGEPQKETEIGLLPKSWEIVSLGQTGEVIYGIQAAVANLTKPIGTKILTNINITVEGEIDLSQLRYYPLTKPRHFKTILKTGDILFNWRSGSRDHVGKTAFFDLDDVFTHSSFILRIRTNEKVFNKYLFYYLTYLRSSGYFCKLQNYSVNAKFNASAVNALPTAVPTYKEQLKIAKTIDGVELKVRNEIKKLNTLKVLFNSMLHHLMTGQIRVKDIRFS